MKNTQKGIALVWFLICVCILACGSLCGYAVWGTQDIKIGPVEFKKEGQWQYSKFFDKNNQPIPSPRTEPEPVMGEYLLTKFTEAELADYINGLEMPTSLVMELAYSDSLSSKVDAPFSIDTLKFYLNFGWGQDQYKGKIDMYSAGRLFNENLLIGTMHDEGKNFRVDYSTVKVCVTGMCFDGMQMPETPKTYSFLYPKEQIKTWKYLGNKEILGFVSPCFKNRVVNDNVTSEAETCMHPKYIIALSGLMSATSQTEGNQNFQMTAKMSIKSFKVNEPIPESAFKLSI